MITDWVVRSLRPAAAHQPSLAQPLADHGLLHRLSPETLVDQATAETLTDLLDGLLGAGDPEDNGTINPRRLGRRPLVGSHPIVPQKH